MSAAASEALLARKERLADEVTRRFYSERPEGSGGEPPSDRERVLQDVRIVVEYLAPAVGLEDPALFREYVRRLLSPTTGLGLASGDDRSEHVRLLRLVRDALEHHLPGRFREPARACMEAGLDLAGSSPGPDASAG